MKSTPAEIIDDKGGPAKFAAAVGINPVYARAMKHRNKIPTTLWLQVATAFPDLTLDVLRAAEETAAPLRPPKPEAHHLQPRAA